MERYVLRVWLPDRPGALGAVASRIGAVKGDVVGIEILETGGGQAVDELVVQLPDSTLMDLLVHEVRQVDGVHVEEVRLIGAQGHDPRQATLETAARLVEARNRQGLVEVASEYAPRSLSAAWVAVTEPQTGSCLAAGQGAPTPEWLNAFVAGSPAVDGRESQTGSSDVIWTAVPGAGLALVAGRDQIAWRQRERGELEALARVVGARWGTLDSALDR